MPIGVEAYERSILPESHWKALYQASVVLVDHLLEDLRELTRGTHPRDLFIASYLPARYLRRYDHRFLRRFLVCAVTVGVKLRAPGWYPLGCTAEELALRAMRELALTFLEMDGIADGGFGDWETVALEDTDCELLFDERRDGEEEPDSPQARLAGYAHLSFRDWFRPFDPPRVVHPYVADGVERPWETDHAHYDPEGSHALLEQLGQAGPDERPPVRSPADLALARLGLRHTPQDYLSSFENARGQQLFFYWNHLTCGAFLFPAGSRLGHPVHDGEAPELLLDEHERRWLAACWSASARKRGEAIRRTLG